MASAEPKSSVSCIAAILWLLEKPAWCHPRHARPPGLRQAVKMVESNLMRLTPSLLLERPEQWRFRCEAASIRCPNCFYILQPNARNPRVVRTSWSKLYITDRQRLLLRLVQRTQRRAASWTEHDEDYAASCQAGGGAEEEQDEINNVWRLDVGTCLGENGTMEPWRGRTAWLPVKASRSADRWPLMVVRRE